MTEAERPAAAVGTTPGIVVRQLVKARLLPDLARFAVAVVP